MLKVLYVDDEPDIREIALMALRLDGAIEARGVEGGAAAIAAFEDAAWIADVVILDLMMPGLDGLALLQRMRVIPAHAATPVIFLTARTGAQDIARLMQAGAAAAITKPFDPMTLAADVKRIVRDL